MYGLRRLKIVELSKVMRYEVHRCTSCTGAPHAHLMHTSCTGAPHAHLMHRCTGADSMLLWSAS
eukprot:COSAG01_NODE_37289_length_505_cov_1.810345_2_plen_63_part_01